MQKDEVLTTEAEFNGSFQEDFLERLGWGSDFVFEIEDFENENSSDGGWAYASGYIKIWGEEFFITVRRCAATRERWWHRWEIETPGESWVGLGDAIFFATLLQCMIDQKRALEAEIGKDTTVKEEAVKRKEKKSRTRSPSWVAALVVFIVYAMAVGFATTVTAEEGWDFVTDLLHYSIWMAAVVPATMFYNDVLK